MKKAMKLYKAVNQVEPDWGLGAYFEKLEQRLPALIKDCQAEEDKKTLDMDIYGPFFSALPQKVMDALRRFDYRRKSADKVLGKVLPLNVEYNETNDEALFHVLSSAMSGKGKKERAYNILLSNMEYNKSLLKKLKNTENIRAYATYLSGDSIMKEERELLEKVAIGDTSGYAIKNRSMDIVVHYFRYLPTDRDGSDKKDQITKDMTRLSRYLRNQGLLFLEVPLEVITTKNALSFAGIYDFVGAIPLQTKEDVPVTMACLILSKRPDYQPDPEETAKKADTAYKAIHELDEQKIRSVDMKNLEELLSHTLPGSDLGEINLFRGTGTDTLIIELVLDHSTLPGIDLDVENERKPSPPLPFRKGQIGQVIASGQLDGVIDEGNGYKHVIRGRVYKGSRVTRSEEQREDVVEIVEKTYRNNLVEINLFAGDGTFKTITMAG